LPRLHAPELCDAEVVSSLRGHLLGRRISEPRAYESLIEYVRLGLVRHGHGLLLARVLQLHRNFSAQDGFYVALAERLRLPLLTTDLALRRAIKQHVGVELLPA
jgi:predicted nucleic acid-binding protein